MRYSFLRLLLPTALLLFSTSAYAQDRLESLAWLAGCWSGDMGGALYEECWTQPTAGFMQGSGRMTQGGKVVMREHVTIEVEKDGGVVMYVLNYDAALKAEQPVVGFRLVEEKPGRFVFENPKHDYPQRIIYTKRADGTAVARIETIDGKRPVDFPLRKASGGKEK